MIDKENIKTTDWLTKGISPEKLEKEKAKAIESAHKELARREKKIQKEKQRIINRLAKVGYTYDEVIDLVETYILMCKPLVISDEVSKRIVDVFNSIPKEYMISYSEAVEAVKKLSEVR